MRRTPFCLAFALLVFLFVSISGCQNNGGIQGIAVFFETAPRLYQNDVFWQGQVVGKILDNQTGRASVAKVTLKLDPQFESRAGKNWAFYVDQGRLNAGRLSPGGEKFKAGDPACGFNSKAAFNWFKFKTLLTDRVGKAARRAENLHLRFG